jgi:hypothetical protein
LYILKFISLKGNGNLVRTYRPVTAFNKIIFGQSTSNNINSLLPIEVSIRLSTQDGQDTISQFDSMIEYDEEDIAKSYLDENVDQELTLDCDQNLQKYFMIESNGDYLNIRFDDSTLTKAADSNKTKLNDNEEDDVMKNLLFLNSSNPIRLTVKTQQTYMFINKKNFSSQINLHFEPPSSKYHLKKSYLLNRNENATTLEDGGEMIFKNGNSSVLFDCNGILTIDEHHVRTDIFNVRKLRTRSNIYLDYLNLSICDESFSFYVYHKKGFNELVVMRNK